MSVWPILLRLLLIVALVSNTMGSAMASAHLDNLAAAAAVQPARAAAAEAPPCDEHHHATLSDDQSSAPAEKAKSPPPSDCCKSGACRCACVQHAPALMIALGFYPLIIDHAKSVRPMSSGHAPPALPHLIRPPIG
jgi:hypothetical protein